VCLSQGFSTFLCLNAGQWLSGGGSDLAGIRGKVGSSPWGRIFNVIITWHMFGNYRDTICGILGEKERSGESRDASTVQCQDSSFLRRGFL
jgi:hypothetical protein